MALRLRDGCYAFVALWITTLTLSQAINATEFRIEDNTPPPAYADGSLENNSPTVNVKNASASHSGYPGSYTVNVSGRARKPDVYLSYVDVTSVDSAAAYNCGPSAPSGSHWSQGISTTTVADVASTPSTYLEVTLTIHARLDPTLGGGTMDGYSSAKGGAYELRWGKSNFGQGPFGITLHGAGLDQYGTVVKNGADTDGIVVLIFRNGGGTDLKVDNYLSGLMAGNAIASSTVTIRPTTTKPTVITAHPSRPVSPVPAPPGWCEACQEWPGIFIFADEDLDLSDSYWDYLPDAATNPPDDYTDLD